MIRSVSGQANGQHFGLGLVEAIDDPTNRVIVVVPGADTPIPRERLAQLFAPEFGIGVVTPQVRRPDGRLMEAGSFATSGTMVSRHLTDSDPHAPSRAADVDGSAYPWMAFRRDLVAGDVLDADLSPADLARLVLEASRAADLRTVYEPGWVVQTTEARSATPAVPPRLPRGGRPETLVVVAFLPDICLRSDDRLAAGIIDDLARLAGESSVTVAIVDGFASGQQAAALRARGIRVVSGPQDWEAWFERHWGRFDHVFVMRSAVSEPLRAWLGNSQPQATRILCLDTLPSRRVEGLRPITPPDEWVGLECLSDAAGLALRRWAAGSDIVLCGQSMDAEYVRLMAPGRVVMALPQVVTDLDGGLPIQERHGVALFASDGYDVASGQEEAVRIAIEAVVKTLQGRHGGPPVTVISDRPSPLLARAILDLGFELVPAARAADALRTARIALALNDFGQGGRDVLLAAMEAGTPFIASPAATHGIDLGPLHNRAVFGDPVDLVYQVQRLLSDDQYWASTRELLTQLVVSGYHPDGRSDALRSLLNQTGYEFENGGLEWPTVRPQAAPPPASPRESPTIRPGWQVRVSIGPVPRPDDFDIRGDERYRMWHERHGPGPRTIQVMRKAVSELSYRPLISVVMPVYNTDAEVLADAIESVRNQIYEEWQLCIADDGSTRAETKELLALIADDPQVRVVTLTSNSGIAAATNAALEIAEGEFIAFMDHDDVLKPHALAQVARWLDADSTLDVVYTDEDKIDGQGRLSDPHLKPDWSPDLLLSMNYISHLTVVRRSVIDAVGALRTGFDGSQDYDLLLRVTEITDRIGHVPEPLYSWRMVEGSAARDADAKPYAAEAAKRALTDALRRRGTAATVEPTSFPTFYRIRYAIPGQPKVSIIVPTKDRIDCLKPCIESILNRSTYSNYEILVVDNESRDGATMEYLASSPVRVVRYPHRFNYARMMNLAATSTDAEVLLFLNNDTEVISRDWMEALLEHGMRPEVGVVGGRLYYTDGRVQHEGILLSSAGGLAWNVDHGGFFSRGDVVRNASAVTGACTMIRSTVYSRIGGNDERLRVAYNDVDICLRARQAGLRVVYTPYAELYHHEGATRRGFEADHDGPLFAERWQVLRSSDPYHSPLFLNDTTDTAFLLAL